ncbi:MAG: ABC transporter permease [Candidatus Acidiferrales bacterium]
MFTRLVGESFRRNPRRKVLAAAALVAGMAVATSTLSVALEAGDRLAREFRSLGANLLVTPQSDTLPLEIGGVDYRPVDEGAYLEEADLGKLKTIFWRYNIIGFTPFLDVPSYIGIDSARAETDLTPYTDVTLIGTWYEHEVPLPDGKKFTTGLSVTHPWWKIEGRWFGDGAKECVVGSNLAAKHPEIFAVGKTVRVTRNAIASDVLLPLVVTGIVSTGGAEDNAVLVPLSVAQGLSNHPGQYRQLFVSALTKPADALAEKNPATMTPDEIERWSCSPYISSIADEIEQVLPGTDVRVVRRVAETEGKILSHISALLWIVTLAALVAAGLAVAATSAAAVLERRDEIGIMKAIGATNTLIAGIFLAEQLMLALVDGAIGFLVGAGLARVLGASVFGTPAPLQMVLLPVVLGLAALVAIAGSLVPLRRAAHLDPVPILRGE